jgi:CHAD domain-containing protein
LKIGHASLEDLDTNARHRLRKSAKTLRYAAEFFAGLVEKDGQKRRRAGFVRTLEKLQDRLGILNDRSTAPMLLRGHGLLELDGAAALIDRHGVDRLVHRAGKAHRRLLDRKRFWD